MRLPRPLDGAATLLCDDRPVAPLRIAASRRALYRGLLGQDRVEGALLLLRTNGVHTMGMRFAIDVACLSKTLQVVAVVRMVPNRWSRPRLGARHTLEAASGAMEAWGVGVGSRLSVSPEP